MIASIRQNLFAWVSHPLAALLWAAAPLAAASAQAPPSPHAEEHPAAPSVTAEVHPRPNAEERRSFDGRMLASRPVRPGCFQAHYPDERWVEVQCAPPPKTPNPRHIGPRPNTVGDGTDYFPTVTSGNISEVTGSFDSLTGVKNLYGYKPGDPSTLHPNVYEFQLNANTFSTTVDGCNKDSGCAGWEQFLVSQSQCGSVTCAFIEYWLLNYPPPCPTNVSWTYYPGTPGTTPGCYLNTGGTSFSTTSLADLGSVKVDAKIQNGVDILTVSDASGTLGTTNNTSIAGLGSGWTGVEYGIYGDCCSTESYFTSDSTVTMKLRVAVANGTTNAPNCPASGFNGTTAETNNLNLTGGCTTSDGATPTALWTETGGGGLPAGVTIGDPHVTTFHGAHYDFQHAGEFIVAEADPDFQVQVRQVLVSPTGKPAIAYNTGAAIRMGPDHFAVTLKGTQVSGENRAIPENQTIHLAGDVTVDHRGDVYTVSRPIGDIVHVTVYNDHLDLAVNVGATNAKSVRGLLVGSNEGDIPMVQRDKTVVRGPLTKETLEKFVESWRIEPNESLMPDEGRPAASGAVEPATLAKLDQEKVAAARKTCIARGVKEGTALDDCTLDVAAMGKEELADGFIHAPIRVALPDR